MKKEDFYGKWILGEGNLKPKEIDEFYWQNHIIDICVCEQLYEIGLIFDSKRQAESAAVTFASIAKGIHDKTIVREDDLVEVPTKPRIYISGPISGYDIEERRKAFEQIERNVISLGYDPVNPMKNGLPDDASTCEHMRRDIELLMTCDYIIMMRRWTHSKGCMVELEVATSIGLTVIFEETGDVITFE